MDTLQKTSTKLPMKLNFTQPLVFESERALNIHTSTGLRFHLALSINSAEV
uniref:Uncharacterized protein n=1 Tax=Arundo donax TaxID=35708 RepID=A0A0A9EBD9_ARUDO